MLELSAQHRAQLAAPGNMALVTWGLSHANQIGPLLLEAQTVATVPTLSGKWSAAKLVGDGVVSIAQDCPLLPPALRDPTSTVKAPAPVHSVDEFLALPKVSANGALVQKFIDHLPQLESLAATVFKFVMMFTAA